MPLQLLVGHQAKCPDRHRSLATNRCLVCDILWCQNVAQTEAPAPAWLSLLFCGTYKWIAGLYHNKNVTVKWSSVTKSPHPLSDISGAKYHIYSNARWVLFLKFGVYLDEVILNSHMKSWTRPSQTSSLWTRPCRAKWRPASPNCHIYR